MRHYRLENGVRVWNWVLSCTEVYGCFAGNDVRVWDLVICPSCDYFERNEMSLDKTGLARN